MQVTRSIDNGSVSGSSQRGQTLVEFALVVIVFLVIVFGLLEFARALWTWNTIVQATRAGARFAVVETPNLANDDAIKNYVVYLNSAGTGEPVLPGLTTSNVTVAFQRIDPNTGNYVAPPNNGAGQPNKYLADVVQVGITGYNFTFVVPIIGTSITLPAFTTTLSLEGLGAT
jgi:Flp pilus assembly protein TadG